MTTPTPPNSAPIPPLDEVSRRSALRLTLGLAASIGGLAGLSACSSRRVTVGDPIPADPIFVPANIATGPASGTAWNSTLRPITRTAWTSAKPKLWNTNPMGRVTRITVHHDGMPYGVGSAQGDASDRLQRIRKIHVDNNGWADIGYHYAIDPGGRVWAARPENLQGAHVKDNNEQNLGILVMGNFNDTTPTRAAQSSLVALIADKQRQHQVHSSRIMTHQEINPTECPGRSLQRFMVDARRPGGLIAMAANGSTRVG